ncbi:MAG TPA: hypothetical protein VI756_27045 [Blastocatellia bacterium]
MADKLLVEIEMLSGSSLEAVYALLFLGHTISESQTIEIGDRWSEKYSDDYHVKWRFVEQ